MIHYFQDIFLFHLESGQIVRPFRVCCTAAALVHYVSFRKNTVQWQLQGVSSQNVFFETPARLSNYDIFNN